MASMMARDTCKLFSENSLFKCAVEKVTKLHRCVNIAAFFQVLVLGNAFTLEQRLHLADHQVHGSASLHNLLTHSKGESLMLNLILPLCLKVGCGTKDSPKLRKNDVTFTLNLLLNMINPNKRGVGLGPGGVNNGAVGSNTTSLATPGVVVSASGSNRSSSVHYHPAGDSRTKIKTSSLEISFLGEYK